ncbi:MAG TPA: SPOR domain-containing protein [bacterium]|nr:SPOR domain-containing protein [bacterium]
MKNENIQVSQGLLVKSLIISFFLLAAAFTAGLLMGRNDHGQIERTSADQGDVQEKLSDCSYRLQEITAKHISMTDMAREKGILDENGRYNPNIVCAVPEPPKKTEATEKIAEKKENKKCLYSIQIFSDPSRDLALSAQKRYDIPKTRLVEGIVNGKNWYRIRSGCYSTRSEAEIDLPLIKEIVDSALVVAE